MAARILLCLTVWLLAAAGASPVVAQSPSERVDQGVLRHGNATRRYLIFDPGAASTPRPLVIMLHGAGGDANTAMSASRFNALAAREGFVAVYPDGSGPGRGAHSWNAGPCCAFAKNNNVDDVGFIAALIDDLVARRNIDPARVYVTGMSNGAMLAHRLAMEIPQKVAAIAPVAGALFGGEPVAKGPVAAAIIIGDNDQVVPGGGGPLAMGRGEARVAPAKRAHEYWAKANGCGKSQNIRAKGARLTEYKDCTGAPVLFYDVAKNGHAWPGNPAARFASQEFDASQVIWDFFKRQTKGAAGRASP